jgi:hypothetical protein
MPTSIAASTKATAPTSSCGPAPLRPEAPSAPRPSDWRSSIGRRTSTTASLAGWLSVAPGGRVVVRKSDQVQVSQVRGQLKRRLNRNAPIRPGLPNSTGGIPFPPPAPVLAGAIGSFSSRSNGTMSDARASTSSDRSKSGTLAAGGGQSPRSVGDQRAPTHHGRGRLPTATTPHWHGGRGHFGRRHIRCRKEPLPADSRGAASAQTPGYESCRHPFPSDWLRQTRRAPLGGTGKTGTCEAYYSRPAAHSLFP